MENLKDYAKSQGYTMNVQGDACHGDQIAFVEGVYSGSYRKPKFDGYRLIVGIIVKDSYGVDKQQHTFTIEVVDVQGEQSGDIAIGKKLRRKARNVYRHFTLAILREDAERQAALDDKHKRGDAARADREMRRIYG